VEVFSLTIVYTGKDELDRDIAEAVSGKQAYYADYLLEEKQADAVILSTNIETKFSFKDFLFELRRDNKRVILLVGDERSPYIGYALALGIYDLIFDPVTIDRVAEVHSCPHRFSDVAHLYLGLRGRVSFDSTNNSRTLSSAVEGSGDPELAIGQLSGIFKLMGRTSNKHNINEMLLDLEQIIIQQFI
jgi:hypothetical protein